MKKFFFAATMAVMFLTVGVKAQNNVNNFDSVIEIAMSLNQESAQKFISLYQRFISEIAYVNASERLNESQKNEKIEVIKNNYFDTFSYILTTEQNISVIENAPSNFNR